MSAENFPKCNCLTAENEGISDDSESKSIQRCCIKQRNWLMLKNMRFSDVCFIVGCEPDTQKIHAHKNVLSDSGTVFEAMFGENWSSKSNEIEVPDIEPAIFSALLRFIYTDDIQLTADSVLKILYAAKKYEIVTLENLCSDFLKEQLSPENACMLLSQARLFDQPKLMESCLEVIDERPDDSLTSDSFTSIDSAALRSILERDTLKMDEVDVFKAVIRWSVAECKRKNLAVNSDNQKLVLDGAESLVRFPLMTAKEFGLEVVPCNLLTKDDALDLYQYFSGIPKTLGFISTHRAYKKPIVVDRFASHITNYDWGCAYNDGIGCDVKLEGFGFFTHASTLKHDMDIMVKLLGTGDTLYQSRISHKTRVEVGNHLFQVLLEKPMDLMAKTFYTVMINSEVTSCCYGEKGKPTVQVDHKGKKTVVSFSSINYYGPHMSDVSKGQIPQILFTF